MTNFWPFAATPWYPSFSQQLMPEYFFDGNIANNGIRLQWMKSHTCPCTANEDTPGSADPDCNSCNGRGQYWDPPSLIFTGLMTFMRSTEAADEPGATRDPTWGTIYHAEPTITIPYNQQPVWAEASEFDAFVAVDATMRFSHSLSVSGNTILPYQQVFSVESVTAWDPVKKVIQPLQPSQYAVSGASVTLIGFQAGTPYTVDYKAVPAYVVWRRSGGLPHRRPFGAGTGMLPVRFRGMLLDLWTRARLNGFDGPQTNPPGP